MIPFVRSVAAIAFIMASFSLAAVERRGADNAYPKIAEYLGTLPLRSGVMYTLADAEVEALISLSAQQGINVFELIDCASRYSRTLGARVALTGASLRAVETRYNLGDERVLSILPVEKLLRLETGTNVEDGQKDVDIYLDSEYETFIEIGNAHYNTRFGFSKLSPLLFDGCYGVQVSRFLFSAPLLKLELYAPAKGAIYVRGMTRPKGWNLQVITGK